MSCESCGAAASKLRCERGADKLGEHDAHDPSGAPVRRPVRYNAETALASHVQLICDGIDLPTPASASTTYRLRRGGGRSFQHRVAANLKEPRNAMVRCFGVSRTCVQALLVRPSPFLAQTSFSNKYFGCCVATTPNIMVARCNLLRAAIFNMFAALRNGVTCARGGTAKQKRAQAFCTLCTSLADLAIRQGPNTVSQ